MLQPALHQKMKLTRPVLALLIGALGCTTQAWATFTVIDDDLLPSSIVEARDTRSLPAEGFAVPFFKGTTALGPMGRKAVEDAHANAPSDATYKIIGRHDAMPATVPAAEGNSVMSVAAARAGAIRQQLLRLGVPAKNIILAPDNSPNPQANGANYLSQIVVVTPTALPGTPTMRTALTANLTPVSVPSERPIMIRDTSTSASALAVAQASAPQPMPAPTVAPASVPTTNAEQASLIAFINNAVRNGSMDASVALTLLARLVSGTPPASAITATVAPPATRPAPTPTSVVQSPAPVAYAPAPASVAQSPAPVAYAPASATVPATAQAPAFIANNPSLALKPVWQVDKNLTLRDNLNEWSKKAGWQASQWEASNYYEVTRSFTVEGEFPEMLRQIADGTGLNICANKRLRIVRVTDHAVRCDSN